MSLMEFRWRGGNSLLSVDDYQRAAARRLPRMVTSFIEGGADDLASVRANREAFDEWRLIPSVLAGIGQVDTSVDVLGAHLDVPILLAPTGLTGMTHWSGDPACAVAAEGAGTRYVLSSISSWSIEEVAERTEQNHFFQLYPRNGALSSELMARATAAGMDVMFLTLDCPTMGNREGEQREGMGRPPVITPRRAANMARHPAWLYRLLRHRRISGRNFVDKGGFRAAMSAIEAQTREFMQSSLSWDDAAQIRDTWPGRLVAKGILSPEDAARAVDLGFDGVVVSNHGGRQLDHAIAPLDCLADIAAAVGGRAEVIVDGGIRRGTDVVKALALGANAVMIGRPYLYGLAVDGQGGVSGVLDLLRDELERAMVLLGCASIAEIDHTVLSRRSRAASLRYLGGDADA